MPASFLVDQYQPCYPLPKPQPLLLLTVSLPCYPTPRIQLSAFGRRCNLIRSCASWSCPGCPAGAAGRQRGGVAWQAAHVKAKAQVACASMQRATRSMNPQVASSPRARQLGPDSRQPDRATGRSRPHLQPAKGSNRRQRHPLSCDLHPCCMAFCRLPTLQPPQPARPLACPCRTRWTGLSAARRLRPRARVINAAAGVAGQAQTCCH